MFLMHTIHIFSHILSTSLFPSILFLYLTQLFINPRLPCVDLDREQKGLKSTAAQEKKCGDSCTEVSNCAVMNDVYDLLVLVFLFICY